MIIQSPEHPWLAAIALVALNQTSTGKHILESQPMATVKLISTPLDSKTYFQAIGGKNHSVHLSETDQKGLLKFFQDPANLDFAKCVAALAHELIHAMHSTEDHDAFKRRNQSEPISSVFDNQEEELTITGTTRNIESALVYENKIRSELGLKARASH